MDPPARHLADPRAIAGFPNAAFEEIYASHVVATLPYREFQGEFLPSVHRLLVPGGVLKLSVPDLSVLTRLYLDRSLSLKEQTFVMRMMFGAQTGAEDFHRAGYDFDLVRRLLEQVGFVDVHEHVGFWRFPDVSNKVFRGQRVSLNVSARKPDFSRVAGKSSASTIAGPSVQERERSTGRNGRVIWGGDVNLGRRQHYRAEELGAGAMFERVPELADADLRIVNLECVIASIGEYGIEKGEQGPYYYRARPEMVRVLLDAQIDVVAVANNHAGDYGRGALMQQQEILARSGIGSVGSGCNREEAFAPIYKLAGDCMVALFAIDATMPYFAAGAHRPGIAHLSLKSPQSWMDELKPRIEMARDAADVVLVAVHWGNNGEAEPGHDEIRVGHAIVDAGADAVLGASAHRLQGVEVYRRRPIIHDAGNLLFDAKTGRVDCGLFRLSLSDRGVEALEFVPVISDFGFSFAATGAEARERSLEYARMSWKLGTDMVTDSSGNCALFLDPPPRKGVARVVRIQSPVPANRSDTSWEAEIQKAACCVDVVPRDAAITEVGLGPLRLLGIRVLPQRIVARQMIWVETYWQADHLLSENIRLDIQLRGNPGSRSIWGRGMDHDPCDWMMPTRHWKRDRIYRDYFGLRPPPTQQIENGMHRLCVGIVSQLCSADVATVPGIEVEVTLPGRGGEQAARGTRFSEQKGPGS